jgi:DNA polymerase-4
MRCGPYLILDFNSYFASVEQQENPKLRGKPVAVVPADTDTTCAIAASYEAKKFGVKTGTRIYEAKRMCPGLILVPARHDIYVEYHRRWMEEVNNHLPVLREMSIDEACFKMIGDECEEENAVAIAQRMKAGVRKNVGDCMRISIGIAPTLLLAKIGSNLQKPDGLTVLREQDLPGPLLDLKLIDLTGIGRNMEAHLINAGICTVADLWALTPQQARGVWGSINGERFWYELHGIEMPMLEHQRRSIGHSRVLAPEMRSPEKARLVARALLLKAAIRLRRYGLAAESFGLSLRPINGPRFAKETKIAPTQDSFALLAELDRFWNMFRAEYGPRTKLLKTSIFLSRLRPVDARMNDLFIERTKTGHTRGEDLWHAVDKLGAKYGKDTVSLGSQRDLSLQYLGAKIAFTRVPDAEEFKE